MNTRLKAQASLVQSEHDDNIAVDLQEKTLQIVRKMQRSCRLCLRSDLEMINLSDEYKDSLTYQGIAVALNIVETELHDDYPQQICISCTTKLALFHNFKNKCDLANCTLKALVPLGRAIKKEQSDTASNSSFEHDADYQDNDVASEEADEKMKMKLENLQTKNLTRSIVKHVKQSIPTTLKSSIIRKKDDLGDQHMKPCLQNRVFGVLNKPKYHKVQCDECGLLFTGNASLAKHGTVHSGFKQYSCDICKQRFTRKPHLTAHMLIHSSAKPYTCDVCGFMFRKLSNMYRHRVVHSDKFAHSCDICHKEFKLLPAMKAHRRIHTGRRVYPCPQCSNSYHSRSGYRKHMLRVHNVTTDGSSSFVK